MEIFNRLKNARIDAGFESGADAARRFGWSEHTYKSHENGLRGIKLPVARKYSKAFNVSVAWLMTGESEPTRKDKTGVTNIPLLCDAAGGAWMEGPDIALDNQFISVSPDPRYDASAQYARKVVGNSVSNRIRSGEYAIFVRLDAFRGAIPNGKLVDVVRTNNGLREHTVKVYSDNRLFTDSAELAEQSELKMQSNNDDIVVAIEGIVIGAFRPI